MSEDAVPYERKYNPDQNQDMKNKVISILESYSGEIDNWNKGVFTDDFDAVAEEIIKLL